MQKLFIDASALVALIIEEPEWEYLHEKLQLYSERVTSALSTWEATIAVSRFHNFDISIAQRLVEKLQSDLEVAVLPIEKDIGDLAINAHKKYGKGRHKAGLNFGDCFSYACAKHLGAVLLFKGDDFALTDLEN